MQQSYTFFRACVIYSHTCMYPNQLLDLDPESEREIQGCAAESKLISLSLSLQPDDKLYSTFLVPVEILWGYVSSNSPLPINQLLLILKLPQLFKRPAL